MRISLDGLPARRLVIPVGPRRFAHAHKLKLEHTTRIRARIGRSAMPNVEVNQRHRASRTAQLVFTFR